MRILHMYKTYYPDTTGGIEKVLWQLMGALKGEGVESRLLVLSPDPIPQVINREEGQIWRCRIGLNVASNPMSWQAMAVFHQLVNWADVVHYQFPWPFGDFLHLLHGRSKPSVVSYQSDVVRQKHLMHIYRPLMIRFLSSVDRICATSPGYVGSSAVLSALQRPIDVIPNGLNTDSCPSAPLRTVNKWRERFGEDFFLFVGVLRYYKGLHTLIQSASCIPATILIAGDGPEKESLRMMSEAANLSNVHFLGQISEEDKAALLQLSGSVVFPSHLRSEAFGMTLVEASMFGKPMISCEIGTGTSFVNLNGITGYTVSPDNSRELTAAMLRLWENPNLRISMGQAAKQRYQTLFTGRRMAQSYHSIYQELVSS